MFHVFSMGFGVYSCGCVLFANFWVIAGLGLTILDLLEMIF